MEIEDRKAAMGFEKVRLHTIPAVVAEQIEIAIHLGRFPVGSRLPSEAKLAAEMGVSRPSIREALSALRAAGLIESRRGSGSYVLRAPSVESSNTGSRLREHRERYLSILEARAAVEPPIAGLAASLATDQDRHTLQKIIADMQHLVEAGEIDGYLSVDKSFHLAVAGATQNVLLVESLAPLVSYMDESLYRVFARHEYLTSFAEHRRVVEMHATVCTAICESNPQKASASMERLWTQTREIWEA